MASDTPAHRPSRNDGGRFREGTESMVYGYLILVCGLLVAVQGLTDRFMVATVIAFGPRWLAAIPLVPLSILVMCGVPAGPRLRFGGILAVAGIVLVAGVMDFRIGTARARRTRSIRVMTHNLGNSVVTADALDDFLTREQVDVAALQECPFYDNSPMLHGWHFYYGGDLCLVSRFPFRVLDLIDSANEWRRGGRTPIRFEILAPTPFQLLNVHFETVRDGVNALRREGWSGVAAFDGNRRDALLDSSQARARMTTRTEPFLVVGDFNLPVESRIYREHWGDLENLFSQCGRGFGYTKFTRLFGIRIDHIVGSQQWECSNAQVLARPYGGDHAPLIVDLQLRS